MTIDLPQCGLRLAYDLTGAGAPVILMHGWGCTSTTVSSIAAQLADRYTVYNLDMPGCGASSEPASPWTVEDYERMLEEFTAALGIERPVLIGHSNGGRVALQYAAHHDVARLVLVDSAGIPARLTPLQRLRVKLLKAFKRVAVHLPGGARLVARMQSLLGSADYNASTPVMKKTMVNLLAADLRPLMPSIACPTLLLWGEDDTATPLGDARQMSRLIPDAGLVSWPGCGHYSFLDNPAAFNAVLRAFLK